MSLVIGKYLRVILCLSLVVFSGIDLHAQKKKKKTSSVRQTNPHVIAGDKYFELLDYIKASEEYKKAYEDDPNNHYALYKLAEAHRFFYDYSNAEKYYKEAVRVAIIDYPLSRYWYGIMLKDNGNYLEAQEQFSLFRKEYKETTLEAELYKEKAQQEAKGCEHAMEELKKPQRDYGFKNLPLPVNSGNADFSVVIGQNDTTITLTSSREGAKGNVEGGTGGNLSDIYRFKKVNAEEWTNVLHEHDGFNTVNSLFPDATGSYTADHAKFYFTRCDEKVKSGEFINYNCGIYVSHFKNGKWGSPILLNENINMPGQWNAQPSISPDGLILFFVSRRPGGLGMHDIWYSSSSGNEDWERPVNMGSHVNTLFSEISPQYYDKEKILFFSSNGHQGFGGEDIFFVHKDSLEDVVNIGPPFNSNRDDSYFILGDKKGYVTSNREGGIGNFDVYTFNIESKESLIAYINNDTATSTQSISVVGTLTNEETQMPAADVGVILADDDSKKLKTSTTNEDGEFRFDNLSTDKNYKVLLDEENPTVTKSIKYQVTDVKVKGSKNEVSKVLFDNIYFDFDKYELKPEANKVLDNLIVFYKKNPEVQIEMSANTDSYGTSDYNKNLSANRGNNALKYLISKGVDKSALVVNAEGEGKPVAANTSEIGRQLNRRVEFHILGGVGYSTDVFSSTVNPQEKSLYYLAQQYNMTVEELQAYVKHEKNSNFSNSSAVAGMIDYYIVQPKNTLYKIAKLYGLTLVELRELNNLTPFQQLKIGQKVKVKLTDKAPSDLFYLVKPGDDLFSVSKRFGLTIDELVQLNAIEGYVLRKNMILKVKK